MRKIDKSKDVPDSLKNATPPIGGTSIDSSVYGADDVKTQILLDQHDKCAYCECLLNGDFGDVEHFRPKRGYTTPSQPKLVPPGYYWLAYEWSNLLVACSSCNRSFKRNHFALADETGRDIAHKDISAEAPLFINPTTEDPASHIVFNRHIVAPINRDGTDDPKGVYTIDVLKLNDRPRLVNNRSRVWNEWSDLRHQKQIATQMLTNGIYIELANELMHLVDTRMAAMQSPEAEYSGMILNQKQVD